MLMEEETEYNNKGYCRQTINNKNNGIINNDKNNDGGEDKKKEEEEDNVIGVVDVDSSGPGNEEWFFSPSFPPFLLSSFSLPPSL